MNRTNFLEKLLPIHIRHNALKRLFDISFSLSILALLFPIFLCLSLLIIITSRGPAIYGHTRLGRGGVPFKCLKFRTMHKDAHLRLHNLLENYPELREEWEKTHKLKNDPRVTWMGKILRRTSMDEFPQFWNVLKGDLSVVGPRPVVEEEIRKHIGQKAIKILSIRPGITGIWQTSGRSNTTYEQRIALDEKYVDEHTLWLDVKLIMKTIPSMLFSKGAY